MDITPPERISPAFIVYIIYPGMVMGALFLVISRDK
jgi:hypothetical protein